MKNLWKVFLVCCLFFSSLSAMGQEKNISGKVLDDFNETVPGVNVQVKGTMLGTVTDADGNFNITVPNVKSVLIFSFIGYATQEITVGNQTKLTVKLKDDTQNLDEVVVVAYGSARKSDLTGALTTLRPDANDAAKASSIDNLLQGKVAGLNVTSSVSAPGAASSVTIRGANSLRGDNQPLYVIDNVPQASTGDFASSALSGDFQIAQDPLSSLNPADIENITVLKDASATAIYGSRGANGVILITTKKGSMGKPKVNVTANFTVANARNLYDMMTLEQSAMYKNSQKDEKSRQFYLIDGQVRYVFADNVGTYLENPNDPKNYRVLEYRNWQKEIYQSAFSQNYSASVSGGSDKIKYYVSASFKDVNGITVGTGFKQGDLRTNLTADLSKTVKLNLTMNGSLRQNNMMAGGNTIGGATSSISRTALDYSPYQVPDDDPNMLTSPDLKTTVFSWRDDYDDITNDKTFKVGLDLSWNIIEHLTYNLRVGGNMNINDRSRWWGTQLTLGANDNGILSLTNTDKNNYSVENLLNWNSNIGKDITFGATVGVTYDDYGNVVKNTKGTDFEIKTLRTKGLQLASKVDNQQPIQKDFQLLSYLGRVNFNFYEKYLLTASVRADGSSKFREGKRWSYFPSASVAWRMEQEEFLKNTEWLDQLKVRVGYGQTGNQSIDPYSTFSDYARVIDYATAKGDRLLALGVDKLQNDGLKWERTTSWNAGVDFGFLHSRLTGTVDLYHKKTTDLLISRTLPASSGFGSVMLNQGSLSNKGIEISLNGEIIHSKDWSWNIGANIGFNKSTIGDLGFEPADFGDLKQVRGYLGNSIGDHFGIANIFLVDQAPGLFFGYKTDGIVQEEDIADGKGVKYTAQDGSTKYYTKDPSSGSVKPHAGDVKYVDMNGDGVIDENDKTIIGDPNPDFTYGFQTRVSWKSLSLSASFNGVYGADRLNTNIRYNMTPATNAGNLTQEAFLNSWTAENHSNLYPGTGYLIPNGVVMDRYVEDASYLRCSDITLNYILPKLWTNKIGFENISVFASLKNAFVITSYSGYDPEVNSFAFDGLRPGIDMSPYPSARSYVFGLNVTF